MQVLSNPGNPTQLVPLLLNSAEVHILSVLEDKSTTITLELPLEVPHCAFICWEKKMNSRERRIALIKTP